VSQVRLNWLNTMSKACITPEVRPISSAGTTQAMASAGRMKMTSTRPIARNIDRGNSRPGLRSEDTWTAFISMPE
jgi:hypothetical protein